MTAVFVTPIPWQFGDAGVISIWTWETEHFLAKVTGGQHGPYAWEVYDTTVPDGAAPRFLVDGQCSTFSDAEDAVREAVAKTFPPRYGYMEYAGELATTFTIGTGERIDFGPMIGTETQLTVRLPNGMTRTYNGHLHVKGFMLRLKSDNAGTLQFNPAHIIKVGGMYGQFQRIQEANRNATRTGYGRIYEGEKLPGCTGQVGYLPGTVDHTAEPCPVHEQNAPHSLFG